MMVIKRRISEFLTIIRRELITDAPLEYQVCESCRELDCNMEKADRCSYRLQGEEQERKRIDQNG